MFKFNNKVETVGTVREFLAGDHKKKQRKEWRVSDAVIVAGALVFTFAGIDLTSAATVDGFVYERINNAFMPLVELVKGLSYPIALVILSAGALMIMIGNREKGFTMIQQGAIGYILVQLMPLLMDLLVEIAKSI